MYKKIQVSVPVTPVSEALPETMFFYVDTQFTTTQVTRIRQMISIVLANWNSHFEELNNGAVRSRYQISCNKYARFNLAPVWFEEKIANGSAAASVSMDALTTAVAANGFGRVKTYIMYLESPLKTSTVKGKNASNPEVNSLSVTINPKALDFTAVTTVFLSGSLWHAWLHRLGYRHPAQKYTSYFAGEAAMSIMRGNQEKGSTPDRSYTSWLD
ncbi:hypothetical protein [Paenibacillus polymyxa]|uniref:hypothetical protein n=1 Tax=Paenibacillus polymyxa TaxID=1406 RepID=UPI0025B6D1BB|nr:hypothetical protein [Paenibacillus polymyxa]MDN4106459.1 hypothetical protein [Paenibacillus polymyxa]